MPTQALNRSRRCALYFPWFGHTFGLLHGFTKKTRTTPRAELTIAYRVAQRRLAMVSCLHDHLDEFEEQVPAMLRDDGCLIATPQRLKNRGSAPSLPPFGRNVTSVVEICRTLVISRARTENWRRIQG